MMMSTSQVMTASLSTSAAQPASEGSDHDGVEREGGLGALAETLSALLYTPSVTLTMAGVNAVPQCLGSFRGAPLSEPSGAARVHRVALGGEGEAHRWVEVQWVASDVDDVAAERLLPSLARLIRSEVEHGEVRERLRSTERQLQHVSQQMARSQEEQEQLRLVLEGTRLGFWDWYPATNEVRFDGRWAEMLGHDLSEIEASLASWESRVHPDDLAACYADLAEHVEGRRPFYENVHRMRHRDGHWVHILDRGQIMARDAEGKPVRFCGTHTDISVQKEAEHRALEASLAKSRFLANMSHELRTPLTAVIGLSGALLEGVYGELPARQGQLLATVEQSGRHLLELINDMLDLSSIDSGGLSLSIASVSLSEVIQETLDMTLPTITEKRQEVALTLDHTNDVVQADVRRLKQVLVNLLINASKFSPPESTIRVSTELDRELRRLRIAVCDAGIGIAFEHHERIFEPFVMLDDSPSRAHSGTGLGLALVRRLVQLHGGTVAVASAPEQGSTFTVELPWEPAVLGDARPARDTHGPHGAPPRDRVLLVEDNPVVRAVVESYLTAHGYSVTHATDGAEGVRLGSSAEHDVVLMDIALPHMDGLTAIGRIRECRPDVPIIALTAHALPGDEERCMRAGADVYLTKPLVLRELVNTIRVISGADSRMEE